MNRRNFLSLAALAIAGKAAERVFPFRVYSIPKGIVVAANPLDTYFLSTPSTTGKTACLTPEMVRRAEKQFMDALGQPPAIFGGPEWPWPSYLDRTASGYGLR